MSIALTIAGSDSGGGAGIQADIKTFSALGVYGASVITAITAQNTVTVSSVQEVPIDLVEAQMDAVLSDFDVGAAKTGMLSSTEIISAVAGKVREWRMENLVVDPVMVAKSGDRLLRPDAVDALRRDLLPLASVVTPNLPEAEVLSGLDIVDAQTRLEAARRISSYGPDWVVIKGGHAAGEPIDLVWDGKQAHYLHGERILSVNTHGTGCTFSAAIAALLLRGETMSSAVDGAKRYVAEAIRHAEGWGHGHGPLNHHFKVGSDRVLER